MTDIIVILKSSKTHKKLFLSGFLLAVFGIFYGLGNLWIEILILIFLLIFSWFFWRKNIVLKHQKSVVEIHFFGSKIEIKHLDKSILKFENYRLISIFGILTIVQSGSFAVPIFNDSAEPEMIFEIRKRALQTAF